ncbi:MAG: DUF4177 domain-containing protein [Oscillospiraceae bacterium]|nr:DUF4177 domain-containing protein [Oscillospiraceae bacterium]
MDKFEYIVISVSLKQAQKTLNDLGQQGWEVVGQSHVAAVLPISFTLKRKIGLP